MSINISGYSFDGPFSRTSSLADRAGVYAILCKSGDKYKVIDVGESAQVKTRVENHDRVRCWDRNCNSSLAYAAYYTPNTPQAGRKDIEGKIRDDYDPPCGKQ